jgi:CRP/FNR family cyclic AMP-dependent transcriptional regulator
MSSSEIRQALASSEFFKGLGKSSIEKIAGLCQVETYEPGGYIFRQGDFGEHIYIIAEGHIFLERSMDMGARQGSAVIGILGKGRVFGCWSTLLGEPHNLMSSATCQKPTKVVSMKGSDLRQLMLDSTELGLKVLERLCFLLRDRIQGAYGAMEKI